MSESAETPIGHRFATEIISHAAWLCHVFGMSLRDVEPLLAERGVMVSYESIRRWCLKFDQDFADKLRRRRPRPGDTSHLDEVFLRINGEPHYPWRAVHQNGVVLDILVQDRRNAAAAKYIFTRLLGSLQHGPRRIIAAGPRSYGVAHRDILPEVKVRQSRYLDKEAKNSQQPAERRERQLPLFKSAANAQRLFPAHSIIYGHFRRPRNRMPVPKYRRSCPHSFWI
jgi:putative transposase